MNCAPTPQSCCRSSDAMGESRRAPWRSLPVTPISWPFIGWAAALALHGTLSHRDHELLALRAAWNCRSVFEWAEHVGYARTAGITELEIDAVTQDVSVGGWSVAEAGLLRAADELHRDQDVSDETRGILASAYDTAQLVEILYVVGQYTMLSMVGNAAGIGTPPGLPAMPVVP